MNVLPVEILTNELASWLSPREIATCRLVCHKWNLAFSDERVGSRTRALMDWVRGAYFFLHELPGEWRLSNLHDGVQMNYNSGERDVFHPGFQMSFSVCHNHPVAEILRCHHNMRGLGFPLFSIPKEKDLVVSPCTFSRYKKFIQNIEHGRRDALARSLHISEAKLHRQKEMKGKSILALPHYYQ